MGANGDRDPFDLDALRIDPRDPTLASAAKARKKKWRRRFIKFPWTWADRLKATNRGSTYRVALHLVYEHWRSGSRAIELANMALAEVGVKRRAKWRALRELEQLGLIKVEARSRKSPLVTLLVDPMDCPQP
jgi:hypothetical protein